MGFTTLFFDPGHRKTPGVLLCGGTPGGNLWYLILREDEVDVLDDAGKKK